MIEVLDNPEVREKIVRHNLEKARKYFSYPRIAEGLIDAFTSSPVQEDIENGKSVVGEFKQRIGAVLLDMIRALDKANNKQEVVSIEIKALAGLLKPAAGFYKYGLNIANEEWKCTGQSPNMKRKSSFQDWAAAKKGSEKRWIARIFGLYFSRDEAAKRKLIEFLLRQEKVSKKAGYLGWKWIIRNGNLSGLHIFDRRLLPVCCFATNFGEDAKNYGAKNVKEMLFLFIEAEKPIVDVFLITNWEKNRKRKEQNLSLLRLADLSDGGINDIIDTSRLINEMSCAVLSQLHRRESINGLTNLYNRRFFDREIKKVMANVLRHKGRSISLVMLDIDHFKKVNDIYGHPNGDKALRAVAKILKNAVRGGDIVARYGGEEFVIILPLTEIKRAREVAERIRKTMEEIQIVLDKGKVIKVTVSLGVSMFVNKGLAYRNEEEIEQLITRADKALYEAKEAGRNRVAVNYTTSSPVMEIKRGRRKFVRIITAIAGGFALKLLFPVPSFAGIDIAHSVDLKDSSIAKEKTVPYLIEQLGSRIEAKRLLADELLIKKGKSITPVLLEALEKASKIPGGWQICIGICQILGKLKFSAQDAYAEKVVAALKKALKLKDKNWRVCKAAVLALREFGPLAKAAVLDLIKILEDEEWYKQWQLQSRRWYLYSKLSWYKDWQL
ncbi:MAG: GGDEF domain-containing protein, partial [Candidatus Omnitrophica bacterium]|nr:GGDEF domain-containing protein [Candidatus Omnitrophota bacterium]